MANPRRGEVSAILNGVPRVLCLTLGALAELESAFGVTDLVALGERFSSGRLAAGDLIRVVGAGLRGAGEAIRDDEVAAMRIDGAAVGFAELAAKLLAVTFGLGEPNGGPVRPMVPDAGRSPPA